MIGLWTGTITILSESGCLDVRFTDGWRVRAQPSATFNDSFRVVVPRMSEVWVAPLRGALVGMAAVYHGYAPLRGGLPWLKFGRPRCGLVARGYVAGGRGYVAEGRVYVAGGWGMHRPYRV